MTSQLGVIDIRFPRRGSCPEGLKTVGERTHEKLKTTDHFCFTVENVDKRPDDGSKPHQSGYRTTSDDVCVSLCDD